MEAPVERQDSSFSFRGQGQPLADLSAVHISLPKPKRLTRKPAAPNLKKAKPKPPRVEYMNAAKRRRRSKRPRL